MPAVTFRGRKAQARLPSACLG